MSIAEPSYHSDPSAFVDHWLSDPAIVAGLRHLEITDQRSSPNSKPTHSHGRPFSRLQPITRLITSLANLKTLIWSTHQHINGDILDALHTHHPKAQLKIYHYNRMRPGEADHTNQDEIALSKSPALVVLKGVATAHHPDIQEAVFRRAVANAPNLKIVSLYMQSFHQTSAKEAATLSKKFYTHTQPNASIRKLALDGYGMSKKTLEDWGQFVDMSKLEDLKCTRGLPKLCYFQTAPGLLQNLKHASLNLAYNYSPDFAAAASSYIENCAPLETLSLWTWMKIVPLSTILSRHGPTLKTLQLHEREATRVSEPRGLLSAENIKSIRDACPRLKDLTFDMDREDSKLVVDRRGRNALILNVLSTFGPQLEKVQIYFDLGLVSIINLDSDSSDYDEHLDEENDAPEEDEENDALEEDEENDAPEEGEENDAPEEHDGAQPVKRQKRQPKPILQPSTPASIKPYIAYIWRTIFGKKTTGAKELDVKFGEWERKVAGFAAGIVAEEQRQKSFWKVRPGLRDDGADVKEEGCVIRPVTKVPNDMT